MLLIPRHAERITGVEGHWPGVFMILFILVMGVILWTSLLLQIDDFFLDLYGWLKKTGPTLLDKKTLRKIRLIPQKRIGLVIPLWTQELDNFKKIEKNLSHLEYSNFSLFLGVCAEDPLSWSAARILEKKHPQVSLIVRSPQFSKDPSNWTIQLMEQIFQSETSTGFQHEIFVIHNAEDIIHPLSLLLINQEMEGSDFIQMPVLPESRGWSSLVAGAYSDEISEYCLRDFPIRSKLKASLPSLGSGSAISTGLLKSLLRREKLEEKKQELQTYYLGIGAGYCGFSSRFVNFYTEHEGKKDFIATRRNLPVSTRIAIGRRAPWVLSAAFYGPLRFGWKGSKADRYFFWRDRRGPWAILFSGFLSIGLLLGSLIQLDTSPIYPDWIGYLSLANMVLWIFRLGRRMYMVHKFNGWKQSTLVPLRWPVVNFIQSMSTWQALSQYGRGVWEKRKTENRSVEV